MSTEDQEPEETDQSIKGKVKEVTGRATGDRRMEADGRADGEDDDVAVDEAEEQVRTEHGDKGTSLP